MRSKHPRVKNFETVFIKKKRLKGHKIKSLIKTIRFLAKNDLFPLEEDGFSSGNVSIKTKKGFIITTSAIKYKEKITSNDLVEIRNFYQKYQERIC